MSFVICVKDEQQLVFFNQTNKVNNIKDKNIQK